MVIVDSDMCCSSLPDICLISLDERTEFRNRFMYLPNPDFITLGGKRVLNLQSPTKKMTVWMIDSSRPRNLERIFFLPESLTKWILK